MQVDGGPTSCKRLMKRCDESMMYDVNVKRDTEHGPLTDDGNFLQGPTRSGEWWNPCAAEAKIAVPVQSRHWRQISGVNAARELRPLGLQSTPNYSAAAMSNGHSQCNSATTQLLISRYKPSNAAVALIIELELRHKTSEASILWGCSINN